MSKQVKKSRQSAKPYKLVMPTKETQKVAQKLYGHIAEVHLSERLPEALPNQKEVRSKEATDAKE